MKCPICEIELVMSDRQGVEIDYCPKCRGIWLDRGELDKIIEKSVASPSAQNNNNEEDDEDNQGGFLGGNKKKEKGERGGFLGDLFDF